MGVRPVLQGQGAGDGDGLCQVDEADYDGEAEGLTDAADKWEELVASVARQTLGDDADGVDAVGATLAQIMQQVQMPRSRGSSETTHTHTMLGGWQQRKQGH